MTKMRRKYARRSHPDLQIIAARAILLGLMIGIATLTIPHGSSQPTTTVAHAAPLDAPTATVTGMRPALATAIAQGQRKAHLHWLFSVYLPRHRHQQKSPAGNHWQGPVRGSDATMDRLNAGLRQVKQPLQAAAGMGIAQSIYMALSSFALPYATPEIADHIVQSCQVHACDPAIVAGLFMHEDGNIANEPGHFNNLLFHDHNPGNIKCYAPGRGCYEGFQIFATYAAGIDGFMELWDYYRYTLGITDFASFVATYCPGGVDGNSAPGVYRGDVIDKANAIRVGW